MQCEKVFAEIDRLYDTYISFWEDVCNIESQTSDKAGVDAVGAYFLQWARKRGWKTETFVHSDAGNVVCVTMHPEADAAPLTLSGHIDTVHPKGLFGYPPVRKDATKIYGPGVTDCKGGAVAAALAMDALAASGFSARPVRLLLQTDEEGGSGVSKKATINYMCEKAKDSVAFLNLEGYDEGKACIARKGIVVLRFAVTGIEAHASTCATDGASAIAEAAYKILEMEKLKDDAGLTCSVGVIRGGSVSNTVPGYCEFFANVRFATQEQRDYAIRYANEVANTVHIPGCTCTVTEVSTRMMMERVERNEKLLEQMNRIFAQNGLPVLVPSSKRGGSDAAEITCAGIPCLDSLGVRGGEIHSVREYAVLESLREAAKRMAAVAIGIEDDILT